MFVLNHNNENVCISLEKEYEDCITGKTESGMVVMEPRQSMILTEKIR